jgi:hypothetical protein
MSNARSPRPDSSITIGIMELLKRLDPILLSPGG